MTGCDNCPSREIYVDDANAWSPSLPNKRLCRPCTIELGVTA